MKAKIDDSGQLMVERAGGMKSQYCPYSAPVQGPSYCGDWCPKFEDSYEAENGRTLVNRIRVCGGPTYEILADDRKQGDAPKEGE